MSRAGSSKDPGADRGKQKEVVMKRRTIWSILAGLVALVVAGIAVASQHGAQTDAATATFSATEVKRVKSRTCEGADGTYKVTHAIVHGEVVSASDPVLAGKLRLRLKSVYNTTEGLGWVVGKAHVRNEAAEPDTHARASFKAVNVGGKLEGLLVGGAGAPHWRLLANFSATLADTGAVTGGTLGAPSADNSALLYHGGCRRSEKPRPAVTPERGKKRDHRAKPY
jgi:hypothetical protein